MSWEPPTGAPPERLRPLGVGEILDATFRLYRENFVPFVTIAAVGVIPTQILSLLILLSAAPDDNFAQERTDQFGRTTTEVDVNAFWRLMAGTLGTALLSLLSALIVSAAISKAVAHYYVDGRHPNVGESLRVAVRLLLPLLGMTILYALGIGAGLVACIAPGVFLYVAWSVAAPTLIMERAGPIRALGRSLRLVRPRWWPTFGLLILVGLMTFIAQAIISTPISLITASGGLFGDDFDSSSSVSSIFVGSTVPGIISGLLTAPFAAIVSVVLYVDLRVRHEGFDIEVLTGSLAANVAAGPAAAGTAGPASPPMTPPPPPSARPPAPQPPPQQWGGTPPPPPPH